MNCAILVLFVTALLPASFEDEVGCKTGEFCTKITVDDGLVARSMDSCSKSVCCGIRMF